MGKRKFPSALLKLLSINLLVELPVATGRNKNISYIKPLSPTFIPKCRARIESQLKLQSNVRHLFDYMLNFSSPLKL